MFLDLHGDLPTSNIFVTAAVHNRVSIHARPFTHTPSAMTWPSEAGLDPRGHLWVTWGVYLWAGKPPLAVIILSYPPDLT